MRFVGQGSTTEVRCRLVLCMSSLDLPTLPERLDQTTEGSRLKESWVESGDLKGRFSCQA